MDRGIGKKDMREGGREEVREGGKSQREGEMECFIKKREGRGGGEEN